MALSSLLSTFLKALTTAGYPVRYAEYPSLDPVNLTSADCKGDSDASASVIRQLVEDEGRDLLLVRIAAWESAAMDFVGQGITLFLEKGESGQMSNVLQPYDKVNIPLILLPTLPTMLIKTWSEISRATSGLIPRWRSTLANLLPLGQTRLLRDDWRSSFLH